MPSVASIRAPFFGLPLVFSLCLVSGCSAPPPQVDEDAFAEANPIMATEIDRRVAEIPFQHREELFDNMVWLSARGEVAIPALLEGLRHEEPKVRSSCAWVLGQIHDRRTIPALQAIAEDEVPGVRLEVSRALVNMGDLSGVGALIEGLDNEKVQVRFYCHKSLKKATGRDFGYDHLVDDQIARSRSVYAWRAWWADQTEDPFFAANYAEQHGIDTGMSAELIDGMDGQPAAPGGETVPDWLDEADVPQDDGSAAPDGAAPRTGEMETGVGPGESEGALVLPRSGTAEPAPAGGETPVGGGSTEGS